MSETAVAAERQNVLCLFRPLRGKPPAPFPFCDEFLNWAKDPADINHAPQPLLRNSGGALVPVPQRQTSWLTDILTTLATASGVGYVATAYSISRWLTRTTRATPQ